jgi:cyclic pyranopterin phosphate synthase
VLRLTQPSPWEGLAPPRTNLAPRLHVNTGASCNNNCVFCAEDDREGRTRLVGSQSPDDLRRILAAFPCREHVCFTTGEPTLNPLLPWLIRTAREYGYQEIALITNGRRLSDPAYLARLVDAGLDLLTVSIHGGDARLHDGLTRTPGAFAQTVRALRNAAPWVRLHTSTVITQRNLRRLRPLLTVLGRVGVQQAVLNVVKPRGRAAQRAEMLLPRYRDVSLTVASVLAGLGRASPPVFVEDVPMCATEDLPDVVRGVLEHNLRFDRVEHEGSRRYEEFDRARTEGGLRTKRAACAACRYDTACPGVWTRYLEVHGWDGLDPVERRYAGTVETSF